MHGSFEELDQGAAEREREALEARGYRVAFDGDTVVTCLVEREGERWQGLGTTQAGALSHALGRMLPSRLARDLWRARAADPVAPEDAAVTETPAPPGLEAAPEPETEAPPLSTAPVEPAREAAADPEPEPEREAATAPAPEAPAEPAPRSHVTRAPSPPPIAPEDVADALARLQGERDRTAADRPRLARKAPELLRLELLARVSRIRAIQGQCPVDEVERAAATAVRDLTALAKAWWPGSVSAMQLRATPLDAGAELGLPGGGRLHDWAEAADAADARLAALPAELAAAGRDDDGWADARACAPAPSAPDARLSEVVAAVDKALAAKPDDPGELEALAARLRWLRPHVDDGPAWADAVGKLRRRASMRSLGTLPGLARRLASDGLPSASTWARELGEDPEAKALKQKRKALMRRSPVAGTPEEQVLTWLAAAFELGDELPNAKIADALAAHRELLLSVDSDDLPRAERVHRRRLRSLQAALRGEAVSDDEDDDDLDADVDPDDNVDDAGEAEVVRLRPHVDGKRALFLTNRASPEIESELRDRLGLDVKLSLVDQRRRQSAAKALSHGGYDLVIVAHRFVGHDVDFDLGPRAKEVGIPYVRASSGRFGSVVRALVRDLGVA